MAPKRGTLVCYVKDCNCPGEHPLETGKPAEAGAPLEVKLEAWPAKLKARATITEGGKTRVIEVSPMILGMILGALRKG